MKDYATCTPLQHRKQLQAHRASTSIAQEKLQMMVRDLDVGCETILE